LSSSKCRDKAQQHFIRRLAFYLNKPEISITPQSAIPTYTPKGVPSEIQNIAFGLSLFGILLDIILVSAVTFLHCQIRRHLHLHKSKANVEVRLKEFQFDVPSTLQPPVAASGPPNIYPGRVWRLEWGDMDDEVTTPPTPGSAGNSPKKITYSVIGPGIQDRPHYTTDYKTYL
jgi:hypothetical protein